MNSEDFETEVKAILAKLDGTSESAIKLLTGIDDLDNYGGCPVE